MSTGKRKPLLPCLSLVAHLAVIAVACDGDEPFGGDRPVIALASKSVEFSATATVEPLPDERTIQITNSASSGSATQPNTGLLSGLKVDRITYLNSSAGNWLEATLSGSTDPATLSLKIKTTTVQPGSHVAHVVLSSDRALKPDSVRVTYSVAVGPTIRLSPSAVTFARAYAGGVLPPPQLIDVTNGATVGVLADLSIGSVVVGAGQTSNWMTAAWLATPRVGAVKTLSLSVPGPLGAGTYTATVPVTSVVGGNSPQSVTATFQVDPTPLIGLTPSPVNFDAAAGGALPGETAVAVSNTAPGSTLSGLTAEITFGQNVAAWLTGTMDATTAPTVLRLTPTRTNLEPGSYTANVRVRSTLQGVAERTLAVNYTLRAVPVLTATPGTLEFEGVAGQPAPLPKSISLSNTGSGGSIGGLSIAVTHDPAAQPAIDAQLQGTSTTATIQVTPRGNLTAGTYKATIDITSTDASVTAIKVPITYVVTAPKPRVGVSSTAVQLNVETTQGEFSDALHLASVSVSAPPGVSLGTLTLDPIEYAGGPTGYLVATLSAPSAPATLSIRPRQFQQAPAPGVYTARVTIRSSAGAEPAAVAVTFNVHPIPCVTIAVDSIGFTIKQYGDPAATAAIPVQITNGCSTRPLSRLIRPLVAPLNLSLQSTTTPTTMTVSVNPFIYSLSPRNISETIHVFADNFSFEPIRNPDSFKVGIRIDAGVGAITVSGTSSVSLGSSSQLSYTIQASPTLSQAVTWSTSNSQLVTVTPNGGLVTAVARGSATITATSVADPSKKGTIIITVP